MSSILFTRWAEPSPEWPITTRLPKPRTTYSVGRIEGGESVNVIPQTALMDVDLRSASESELSRLEDFLLAALNRAVIDENVMRSASGN